MRDIHGVLVATATPFQKDGSVDYKALDAHLRRLSQAGIHGLVPCGSTGESASLSHVEWTRIIECSVRIAQENHLVVIAGCGSNDTETALKKLSAAADLGCHAGLVVTPYYNRPTTRGVIEHFRYLADNSPLPFLLYHNPGRTNVFLPLNATEKIFESPKVIGIKEASPSHTHWLGLAEITSRCGKTLLAGNDDSMATLMAFGAAGIISASANVVPKPFVKIFEAFNNANWSEGFQLQRKLNPLIQTLFRETSPAPIKKALSVLTDFPSTVRLPLVDVEPETESELASCLKEWAFDL